MMSREEEKDVQASDLSAIEASCPLANPGGGGGNNNDGNRQCMAMVPASQGETKITNSKDTKEDGWEVARAWLMTLPRRRNVMQNEIEDWLNHNQRNLSEEITNMPRQHIYRYLVSQHKLIRRADQPQSLQQQKKIENNGIGLSGGLQQRQMSVNSGLMQRGDLSAEYQYSHIDDSLRDSRNLDTVERNAVQKGDLDGGEPHPRNNIPGFIDGTSSEKIQNSGIGLSGGLQHRQKLNSGLMQRGELSAEHQCGHIDVSLRDSRNSDTVERNAAQKGDLDVDESLPSNNIPGFIDGTSSELKNSDNQMEQEHESGTMAMALTMLDSGNMLKDDSEDTQYLAAMGRDEALRRYELLSELEDRLITLISNLKQQRGMSNLSADGVPLPSQWSAERNVFQFVEGNDDAEGRTKHKLPDSTESQQDLASRSAVGQRSLRSSVDAKLGRKRKKAKDNLDISVYALSQSEAQGGSDCVYIHFEDCGFAVYIIKEGTINIHHNLLGFAW